VAAGACKVTPDRLKELRALCDAATPGPWRRDGRTVWSGDWRTDGKQSIVCTYWHESMQPMDVPPSGTEATLDMIAASRSVLPEALDEIERLRQRLADMERIFDDLRGRASGYIKERDEARKELFHLRCEREQR
jgi:hypothetical protein